MAGCFNNGIHNPLTFQQLDILADILSREMLSVHQEYCNKTEFVNERLMKATQNEHQIYDVVKLLGKLKLDVERLEVELQCMDGELQSYMKTVDDMHKPNYGYCSYRRETKSERNGFMELMQQTDFKMLEMENFLCEMQAFLKFTGLNKGPYDVIIQILNYHNEVLCSLEKKMDVMLDKILMISTTLQLPPTN
ncbi:uncharacterized protein LOC106081587 isoform X1 [Stomoxys calcitrans]|uniref:uncharacterized protein LOC106081587 isoform X1 n=1 Tax=Stomoxys calcitrans TaxID=35570 RepID=UPI0027E38220|nr:uncharacterized protein LOC106081587 isoform X1 [Stomoxys calcitrans]